MEREERCICCGAVIPEGRQICFNCENKKTEGEPVYKAVIIRKNGETYNSGTLKNMLEWIEGTLHHGETGEVRISLVK